MSGPAASPLYTIGYAAFSPDEFVRCLREYAIGAVVDVRAEPAVSHFPAYRYPAVKNLLAENRIYYLHLGRELGARPAPAALYTNGRADFAKIAAWPPFREALGRVREGLKQFPVCLMCAQKDPLNCHRSILISRYFADLYPEIDILHILPSGETESETELRERLLKLRKLDQPSLIGGPEERLAEAWALREREIAWERRERD